MGVVLAAVVVALVSFTGTRAVASGLVTGRQIKDGSITSVDLKTNAGVTGADVHDGSLSPLTMSGMPKGAKGAKGSVGLPGLNGLDNFDYHIQDFTVPASGDLPTSVACGPGEAVVGGGLSSISNNVRTVDSHPLATGNGVGWIVTAHNEAAADTTGFVWAVCVTAP